MESDLQDRIEALNDLELTVLSCLVAGEHCIMSAAVGDERHLRDNVFMACDTTLGITPATLTCTSQTTIDELNNSLILKSSKDSGHDIARIAILYDLDLTNDETQVQVIELLRTKRVYTRSAMHVAPKDFLLLITTSKPRATLSYHLNDMIAASHLYTLDDSVVTSDVPLFSSDEIDLLRTQALQVRLTAEVDAYLYDIVLFLRLSRYIQAGVSGTATRQMRVLCKALAALHGINFITPSIVVLAARKVYPHRVIKATSTTEKSLQWGSDPAAVERLLGNMSVPEVIEDVIASVETPL